MYEFVSLSYFIILMLTIVDIFLLITAHQSTWQSHTLTGTMMMVSVFMLLSALGSTIMIIAKNPYDYIMGQKLVFLGGCFIHYFLFCFYRRFLAVKLPSWIVLGTALVSCVLGCVMFTYDKNTLVFKNYKVLSDSDGHYYYDGEMGPFLYAFFFMTVFYSVALTVLATWNFIVCRKKKRRTRSRMLLIAALSCPTLPFFIELIFKTKYMVMPFGMCISMLLLTYLIRVEKIHDIADMAREFVYDSIDDGVIILDEDRLYNNSNSIAQSIFPELKKANKNTTMADLSDALGAISRGDLKEVHVGDSWYQVEQKEVVSKDVKNNRVAGWVVKFIDITEHKKHTDLMENYQKHLETEVKIKTKDIERMRDRLVVNIANMIENRDNPTGGHVKRTSDIVAILVSAMQEDNELGLSDEFYNAVIKTAPMHDLGKMAVDDSILLKPGKFTPEEFEIMKTHAPMGANFVASVLQSVNTDNVIKIAENIARYHHEKWAGNGYPEHLKGEQIPIEARIMAIADVYDALVSKRCYKDQMSFEQAYDVIISSMGTHFDPKLEKYFIKCRPKLEAYYKNVAREQESQAS